MKKIIELIADSSLSGAPKHVFTMSKYLKSYFDLTVLCPRGYFYEKLKKEKINVKDH